MTVSIEPVLMDPDICTGLLTLLIQPPQRTIQIGVVFSSHQQTTELAWEGLSKSASSILGEASQKNRRQRVQLMIGNAPVADRRL